MLPPLYSHVVKHEKSVKFLDPLVIAQRFLPDSYTNPAITKENSRAKKNNIRIKLQLIEFYKKFSKQIIPGNGARNLSRIYNTRKNTNQTSNKVKSKRQSPKGLKFRKLSNNRLLGNFKKLSI